MATAERSSFNQAAHLTMLYREYGAWLLRHLRNNRGEDPEDIVQETFLRAALYQKGEPIRHPKALLMTIAKNIVRSNLRSNIRQGKVTNPISERQLDAAADQFETVVLKQTILALPEIYRDVFLLSRFDGMSYEQIAEARGISVKTVEWRMTRALAMCAAKMRD